MNNSFYTQRQWKVFAEDLLGVFLRSGFEILEEPYIDNALYGFRATFIRRYVLQKPIPYYDGILTTVIHVAGLPFGFHGQKMVILSAPRNLKNEPISETIKLRLQFDDYGLCHVVHHDQHQPTNVKCDEIKTKSSNSDCNPFVTHNLSNSFIETQSNHQPTATAATSSAVGITASSTTEQFIDDLVKYVCNIIETISPGLIQLPTEMKLEILKKLKVESIIRMSQVNSEFRSIIFQHGESLWRHLCRRDFNIKFINRMVHNSWMELYKEKYIIQQVEICRKERALPGLPERPALPPVPYRLQIEWLPEVLELPWFYL